MDFRVGDLAMVNPDIASFNAKESPTINKTMQEMGGEIGVIAEVGATIHFQDLSWAWLPKWLLPVSDIQDNLVDPDISSIL